MKWGWYSCVGAAAVASCVGYVAGSIATSSRQMAAPASASLAADLAWDSDLVAALESAALQTDAASEDDPGDTAVYYPDATLPRFPASETPAVHAAGVIEAAGGEQSPRRPPEPAALPDAPDAAPLPASSEERRLRQIVESELADIPEHDREIWIESLRGLPPEDALGILKLWRKFGGGPTPGLSAFPAFEPEEPSTILVPDPVPDERGTFSGVAESAAATALHHARQVVVTNLLNSETIGYRRREALFTEISLTEQNPEPLAERIDQSQGVILQSSGALDFCISGEGLFVVTDGEREYYTRCGRFQRDADGRLILQTSRGALRIQPEVTIPDQAAFVEVDQDGRLTARIADSDEPLGQFRLAAFADAARLEPVGDALFVPTPASGAAQQFAPGAEPGRAKIENMRLERANVSVEHERRTLRQIEEWIDLLQQHAPASSVP